MRYFFFFTYISYKIIFTGTILFVFINKFFFTYPTSVRLTVILFFDTKQYLLNRYSLFTYGICRKIKKKYKVAIIELAVLSYSIPRSNCENRAKFCSMINPLIPTVECAPKIAYLGESEIIPENLNRKFRFF